MSDDKPTTPTEHLERARALAEEQRTRNAEVAAKASTLPAKPPIPSGLMFPTSEEA